MRLRFVVGGLIALLTTAGLASCAPAPSQVSRSVGDCWQVSAGEAQAELRAPHVEAEQCDEKALAITYFVSSIDAAALSDYLTQQVEGASSLSDLPLSLASSVLSECETELTRVFAGATREQLRSSRAVWDFTLPSQKDWRDGARWFSCELSVVALGSSASQPVWEPLSKGLNKLTTQLRTNTLALCIDTATNEESPLSSNAVVVGCSSPRWMLNQQKLRITSGDFYPGLKKAQVLATTLCEESNENALGVVAAPLTEAVWKSEAATVSCWVSNKPNPVDPAAEAARIAAEQAAAAEEAARQASIQQSARARYWRPAQTQENPSPQGSGTSPTTTPEPVPTTPEPVPTTPEPVPTTPEPVPTTPEPVPTPPEPELQTLTSLGARVS